ncbi:hypothetical protein EV175_003886 [Coemansia sp. RSA 1933]|nr:hypothetical protein EV175_003886 [Coemansia sp. RSA 1933]
MPFNVDYNSRVPESSPDGLPPHRSSQDEQHRNRSIKESLERTVDKVKHAIKGNKKDEHDYAFQSGATEPVPMGSDPRVEPLHNPNPPDGTARYGNVYFQDYVNNDQRQPQSYPK